MMASGVAIPAFPKASKEESNELFMILPILLASIGFTYLRMSDKSSSELISTVERIRMLLAVCIASPSVCVASSSVG